MKYIFVDGYNVINSWPQLNEIKDYSLQAAREKLIEILQNYASYNGYKVFLVFDAHMVDGSIEKRGKYGENLTVVFTKEKETADSFIEKKVNNIGRKIEVCVVTSDLLEQQLIFQRGATRMSSLEFYHEVKSVESRIQKKIEKGAMYKRNTIEETLNPNILEKLQGIIKNK